MTERLIDDGRVDDGLRLMEFDVEQTPGKVWLIRKTAQAFLDNRRPMDALSYAKQGLKLRPDDERFQSIMTESEQALNDQAARLQQSQ